METRPGVVSVKAEFLIQTVKKESHNQRVIEKLVEVNESSTNTIDEIHPEIKAGDDMKENNSSKRKATVVLNDGGSRPNHMSSKKRHQESHPDKTDRLCSFVAKGDDCPFKLECKYNHDALDYLANKPVDLGPVCYQFINFGFCSNGIMCRFGDCHIDRISGKSFKRPEVDGGVIVKCSINVLKKEVQVALRKKKYDDHIKQIKLKNCTAINSDSVAHSDARTVESLAASTESVIKPAIMGRESAGLYYNLDAFPDECVKLVDFSNKVYVAPLTTVGNLPFRRIMKEFGADITCGEMAMANNLEAGQASEWALLRRHSQEDVYGVQIAGSHSDMMARVGRILEHETSTDFVDLNCGCPIDVVCNRGCGSSLMNKHSKLCDIVAALAKNVPSRSITVKVRTGWDDKNPTTHKLMPLLQKCTNDRIAAIFVHGRSRLQRYSKLANWDYVLQAAQAQDSGMRRIPVVGNGDIFSWEDWNERQQYMQGNVVNDTDSEAVGLCSCAMIGRGALIKPWLAAEIKEQRMIDISASERLDILKKFCNYGLEHWGSDQQGVNTTRRFLLEWLSFLHRYVPLGLVESTQKMNQRPPLFFGRCDLETLLASQHSADWVRISEMLLGPVPDEFNFIPKHKSNSYGSAEAESVSNG